MEKKYKLTEETINVCGRTLHRIEALINFDDVEKGDKGGFIENEKNLSQSDDCWIYGNAKVFGNAKVYGNAVVRGNAKVFGKSKVCGNAVVRGNAEVFGKSKVCGNAEVFGYPKVYGNAVVRGNAEVCGYALIQDMSDYIVFKNWWSSGRFFTWTKSNNMWKVGCFYGTGKELVEKAYKDSEISGREYERVVNYVESILNNN